MADVDDLLYLLGFAHYNLGTSIRFTVVLGNLAHMANAHFRTRSRTCRLAVGAICADYLFAEVTLRHSLAGFDLLFAGAAEL